MAGGILGTGVSGLSAAQHGLDTTGHNIANVNTEGYSRQRVETTSTVGDAFRSTFLGNGTQLAAIERSFNEYNFKEIIFNSSQYEYNNTRYTNASRLDNLLANPDTGITATFEEMFDGINGIAEEPTLISARNVVLSRAENTAKRFNTMYEEMAVQHMGALNEEITTSVEEINSICEEIAFLNSKIQVENAVGSQGFPPNDLLDKREVLLKRLSEMLQVDTIPLKDGTVNISVGQGITLVTGGISIPMSVVRNEFDSSKLEVGISADPNVPEKAVITSQLSGGSLTGLFETRDKILLPAIREIGKLATAIADSFNRQQSLGRDLDGNVGENLFKDVNDPQLVLSRTLNSKNNAATSTFEVYIRNSEQLSASEYNMEYDGTNLIITDADNSLVHSFSAADVAAMNGGTALEIPGTGLAMAIDVNNLSQGDKFQIRAVNSGASEITRTLTDPKALAAADNAFEIGEVNNPNNVTLNLFELSDPSNVNLPNAANPQFQVVVDNSSGTMQYDIQNPAGVSLIGGFQDMPQDQLIEGPGVSFKIDGILAGNEVFTFNHADNANNDNKKFGPGDNTNMLTMLAFQSEKKMDGGLNSFSESYADLVTTIGVETKSREISKLSFGTLLSGSEQRMAGIQGVNLDEEAANLIQYQQAYSAAARIITVARETFQTLLQSAG